MTNLRQQLSGALAAFAKQSVVEAATALFKTLGYHSEKRMEFSGLQDFLGEIDHVGKYTKLFPDARTSAGRAPVMLLQLTSEEIASGSGGQLLLVSDKKADLRLFESYLFLAISLPDRAYTRVELADRARVLNGLFRQPVLILFRYSDLISMAITYRRAHKRDQSRDVLDRKVTLIKDISCTRPHRAHLDILLDFSLSSLSTPQTPISTFAQLDDAWRKTLSTEALNHRFYKELAAWYYWAVNTIRLPIIADYLKERKDAQDENIKQFTIRLLCRTIFCWFLKERGLIDRQLLEIADDAGQDLILVRQPLKGQKFSDVSSYYRGILQNVFFNCLNTPMDQRRLDASRAANDKTVKDPKLKKLSYRGKQHLPDDFDYDLFDRIPYLNGGLFDVLPEDNASDTIDDDVIHVPNDLFYASERKFKHDKKILAVKGLNRILDGYKFTIAENTPLEEEIALDPELLGLVFENLLAEVDTSDEGAATSARKASGSYYTPRRVIDYMVNEALRLHLENYIRARAASPEECQALQSLLYHDSFDSSQKRLAGWIVEAFDEIRILDPACGSGAFPMGALHRMVALLQRVDPQNRRWLHRQVSHIPDRHLRETAEKELARHADDYSRKLGLIKNAVYGVDIQPLAVLITKLRFFISLLVDQNINLDNPKGNYGLTPLPNLETKVLCANTLREVQVSLFEREAIRKYQSARDEYYQPETQTTRREELADEIAAALSELLPGFSREVTGHEYKDKRTQDLRNRELLKEWFRHSTLPAPFFNFAVFFPEICADAPGATVGGEMPLVNDAQKQQELVVPGRKTPASPRSGFDIVIGNPPYGGDKIPDEVKEALHLGSKDPYGAFIARFMGDGKQSTPLRIGGVLSYIVSDTFMTIKTHRSLREQLMGSRIHKMIRVHPDTFSATVNTAIILLQRGGGPGTTAPTEAELTEAWAKGPWCQMVDLTQVSISEQHDRFLNLLFETAGSERRRDVSTESCAVYHYPQTLIARNTNLPFFVASPKLFELMNDTTAPVRHVKLGEVDTPVRSLVFNGRTVRLVRLGDIADVKQGLATGDNDSYLFQSPEARGSYRSIDQYKQFLLTDADLEHIRSDSDLRHEVSQKGISKENKSSRRYFEGRYIVPFDKGGESDAGEGWTPNYWVPTDYFIDWSEFAIDRMRTLTIGVRDDNKRNELCAVIRNADAYFAKGITYSPTGIYSPSFRRSCCAIFGNKGSTIIPLSTDLDTSALLGVLASKAFKYFLKPYRAHTVESPEQGLVDTQIPFPIVDVRALVAKVIAKQRADPRYDYAPEEQLEIDRLVYDAYGLTQADIAEVETWFVRRYSRLATAQRRNLRAAGKVPYFDRWCVYCDETGHLAYDHAPDMILGALLVPRDRVRPLTVALRERLAELGWPAKRELKWTKVSPAGLRFYEVALDFFLNEPDLRFRALISPKHPPPPKLPAPPSGAADPESADWEKYNKVLEDSAPAVVDYMQRHEAWYYDRYFDLLRETLIPPARHAIFVDVKDTRGGTRIRELENRLADAHYDWTRSGIVEGVSQIASHDVLLDQLVDILLGCVAWIHSHPQRNVGHQPSPAKAALASKVKAILDKADTTLVPKIVVERSLERNPVI
ncbi:MAG: hypothetical protein WCI03_09410 [bacterium]|jgi:hypothetical protein